MPLTFAAAAAAAALVWNPAPGWTERPDPCASPYAVKGGTIRFNGHQPPKSFNAYLDTAHYTRMTFALMYDTLVSIDRDTLETVPATARRWAVSADGREFHFEIDPRAKWSDGVPVTVEDVIWTYDTIMSPDNDTGPYKSAFFSFERPEKTGERTLVFRKKPGTPNDLRDLVNCGDFWILPSHAMKGTPFQKIDLTKMPVCGPYRLKRVAEQVEAVFERVPEWWRAGAPAMRGLYNFDTIVLRFFADETNAFEALKKKRVDVHPVYMARIIRDETHGEKFARNRILVRRVRNHRPVGFQGFAMNIRRPPFDDVRVRKAMAMLIDRETMNSAMMGGEYALQNSYYSDMYDPGHPCKNEAVGYDPAGAAKLLAEAGFAKNPATGRLERGSRPFEFTFLSRSRSEDKFLALFDNELKKLGIKMSIELKDFAAWLRDMDEFNFDMTWQSWGASIIRHPETSWHSREAANKGGNNTTGFASAEADALIESEKSMMHPEERKEAYRKLDGIIFGQHPYALLWNTDVTRLIYWNKFGTPETILSRYGDEEDVLAYWWYDKDKAEELVRSEKEGTSLPSVPLVVDYDEVGKGAK